MDHQNPEGYDEDIDESPWDSPVKSAHDNAENPSGSGKLPAAGKPTYQEQDEREASLRQELESVRLVNDAIEGVIHSLAKAKDNMKTVNNTVSAASTLLNTWTRILSQTEHSQRLILDPTWQGASQDIADIEEEALEKQRSADRREAEEEERKIAAAKRAEEEEKRKSEAAVKQTKITSRGRGRIAVAGRGTSKTSSSYVQVGASNAANTSGIKRGTTSSRRTTSGVARGVGRGTRGRG